MIHAEDMSGMHAPFPVISAFAGMTEQRVSPILSAPSRLHASIKAPRRKAQHV